MADHYDLVPDLAEMLVAAFACRSDTVIFGQRVTLRLGIGEDDSAEAVAGKLREALGLGACEATRTASGTVCGVTPAALYASECEHGHPREGRLCARHAATAGLWCRECFEADGTVRYVTPALVPEAVARVAMPGRVSGKRGNHGPGCGCTPCKAEPSYQVAPAAGTEEQ